MVAFSSATSIIAAKQAPTQILQSPIVIAMALIAQFHFSPFLAQESMSKSTKLRFIHLKLKTEDLWPVLIQQSPS